MSGIVRGSRFGCGAMGCAEGASGVASAAAGSGTCGGAGAGFAAASGSVLGSRFGCAGTDGRGPGPGYPDGSGPA
ncbi:hypothetical protein [Streptomyces scabiei]|uniref:hypothetical protein n=1 Tax=Streptomyces scabiei TaxID=1930 RepID=UPI001FF5B5AF|nr:hypothetical protein [Streptomyces sp. LBUM 1481]